MKYKDILQFEPITDVIQVDQLTKQDYCQNVIKSFVYPDYFISTILPSMVGNIDFSKSGRKGIQIIGNYGTGKSHLMSLVSLIAEDKDLLQLVTSPEAKDILAPIAGKYRVLRFEMGNTNALWDIVTYQLQRYLNKLGVEYTFEKQSLKMYREQLEEMMAAFEEKYPSQGLFLMIDEMLSYMKGRASTGMLNQDLQVLQALGQLCTQGHFAFIYGVQEMIYQAPEFQNLAQLLMKVKDRYVDMTIRKEEVAFIVHDRLLHKSEQQKQAIRSHLEPFRKYFSGMNAHFEDYVELFPVHPSYFDNFQRIRCGRAQREVLKTLSDQFQSIMDNEIPTNEPGLITYDSYWEKLMKDKALQSTPDFKTVLDTVNIVHDKIEANFTDLRAKRIPMAKRIVNATAIKILQDSLDKCNGANADLLVEDLCLLEPLAEDKEFLVDLVENCANFIVSATSGQYFERNEDNGEFHLRTEGGINVDQIIKQQAETMSTAQKDTAYFEFMVEALGIEINSYRTGFRIFQHELPWASHKVNREGYIFFGNSNEKSTTQPKQYFYMMFMPIFQSIAPTQEEDEIHFDMTGVSETFKNLVCLHGAAKNMIGASDSSQKDLYRAKKDDLFKKTKHAFDECYLKITKVIYKGEEKSLISYTLPPQGCTKMDIFDSVSSTVFEANFEKQTPQYPKFSQANQTITSENQSRYIKNAFMKLQTPTISNLDGQAILSALGLFSAGNIDSQDSIYAQSILKMMSNRDEQMVVNKDEILEVLAYSDNKIWRSKDFQLDAAYEFVVLATLAFLGECEIVLNDGRTVNASNIGVLSTLQPEDFYTFSCIKRPKGLNLPVVKAITLGLCGKDLSNALEKEDTYASIVNKAKDYASKAAMISASRLSGAVLVAGVELLSADAAESLRKEVDMFKGFCDKMSTMTGVGKLKNLEYSLDNIKERIGAKDHMEAFVRQLDVAKELEVKVNYLNQAQQYVAPETQLANQLSGAIQKLASVLQSTQTDAVHVYEDELNSAKKAYIEYYMKLYNSYCISDIEEQKRTAILNSDEYKVCNILSDSPILDASLWTNWRTDFFLLKTANPQARTLLESTPYVPPFNPLNSSKELPTVLEMETALKDLYATYIQQLKDYLKSDDAQSALKLSSTQSQDFANQFLLGLRIIQSEYDARTLVEFVNTICDGFEKAEIEANDLAKCFNRPMTIDEAKTAFATYLQRLTAGKAASKVRITFKLQ